MIRKRTEEEASSDYPRRLVSLPGEPLGVRKGRPGFLGTVPFKISRKYLRSERARRRQFNSHRPVFLTPITLNDLYKFFGILLYTTKCQLQNLKDYWKKKPGTASFPEVQMAMAYDRFALIYRCFRFSEEEVSQNLW